MPSISIKPIKPSGDFLNIAALQRAVEKELDDQAKKAQKNFEKSTSTWADKPAFTIVKSDGQRDIGTDDENYTRVNDGTRPHLIVPKFGKMLRFRGGSAPKTMPNVLGASSGGKGGAAVFAKEVHHPGTKPRKFDDLVADEAEKLLAIGLQQAIDSAVK